MNVPTDDALGGMLAAMGDMEAAANASLTPGQVRLRDAADQHVYFARLVDGMVIYGSVPSLGDSDADPRDRHRGYLTGTCYSVATPDGEYGDTHVYEVVPISVEVFEAARAADWPEAYNLSPELGHALASAEQEALR